MQLTNAFGAQKRQIELNARCNVSTIDFLGKVWFYKHYSANFFKDADNTKGFLGHKLLNNDCESSNDNDVIVQCDYIKNKSIESWISKFDDFSDFVNEMNHTNNEYDYKQSKEEVYITSLSSGTWFKTNPRIWKTNETYYQIDDSTQDIKAIVPHTDPVISGKTGKSKILANEDDNKNDQNSLPLDQHIQPVMCLGDAKRLSKYLSDDEVYQFSEILQKDRCCIPFVMVVTTKNNPEILNDVANLMVSNLDNDFPIKVEMNRVGATKIPCTNSLLSNPYDNAYMIYYMDNNVRFDSLKDQKRWWRGIQNGIDTKPEYSKYKYFQKTGTQYQQKYYINFDIYEDGSSVPIHLVKLEDGTVIPISPSNYTSVDAEDTPETIKVPERNFVKYTLPSFSVTQLENEMKITLPGVNSMSFRQSSDNSISFERTDCLMGLLKGLDEHVCKEKESSVVFNTVYKRTEKNKGSVCELRYKCDCHPGNSGEPFAYIMNRSFSKKRKLTSIPNENNNDDITYEPVTLDERVEFPEELNFEETIKNTDVGFAEVFNIIYKNRFTYNPENSKFYYYDGDIWQEDKTGEFTDTVIAKKLASTMDNHIRELENEKSREENRQRIDKGLISALGKRIAACDKQRERLTNGISRVKKFIKIELTDKYFKQKIEHPGKIAAFNGLIDLKTLNINSFKPKDYVTEKCKYAYYKCTCKPGECFKRDEDGNLMCNSVISKQMQKVDDIIREIMGCDAENADGTLKYGTDLYYHFMWCIGYGLSGEGNKKYVMYCHSPQNSGKSLLLGSITEILPQYFGVVPNGALFGHKNANGPTPELVLLLGKRAGVCDEVRKGAKFDDRNAKAITGRSKMEWRGMGQEYQVTKFKLTPYIAANDYIEIDSLDDAFWDRMMPILFPIHFARDGVKKHNKLGTKRLRDETLVGKFESEPYQMAYFNWLVRSCAYFYSDVDKTLPHHIKEKISELKKESYALDEFILNTENYEFSENDKCEIKPLYDEFKKYAQDNNIKSKMGFTLSQFRNMIRQMSDENSGYERKIKLDDTKSTRVAKSCVKGIKKVDRVSGVDTDYHEVHFDPTKSRPNSPLKKREREQKSPDLFEDDEDYVVELQSKAKKSKELFDEDSE